MLGNFFSFLDFNKHTVLVKALKTQNSLKGVRIRKK